MARSLSLSPGKRRFSARRGAIVGLLALGRFFLALGGLDPASAFGGMGSSREMTIAAIAEPALMLGIFTVAITAGSTRRVRLQYRR